MKILNVNSTIDPAGGGGTAERTFQMSRYLAKHDVDCGILTLNIGVSKERIMALSNVELLSIPCLNKRFYIPGISFNRIIDIVKKFDLAHLMGHWTVLNAIVYRALYTLRKPYVVCPAGALPLYGRSRNLKRIFNYAVGQDIISNANACIAISKDEVEHFTDYGVDPVSVFHIPNGIDPDQYKIEENRVVNDAKWLPENPFILFLGRLNKIKGPDLLMKAFCELRNDLNDFHLVYVGPDEGMRSYLEDIASYHHMQDRIHYLGYLKGKDKINAIASSELVVIPSRQEAMSIVVLEAGVMGKPVLLTDRCGFNEVSNVRGGVVVPDSVEGLMRGLLEILKNKETMEIMGENLRALVNEHYTWDRVIKKFIRLYEKILCKA